MSLAERLTETGADDPRQVVAAEIRALMGRHRVQQQDLAAAIGISQSSLSRRLKGEIPFDIDELTRIASYFDVRLAQLLDRIMYFSVIDGDGPQPGQLALPLERHLTTV